MMHPSKRSDTVEYAIRDVVVPATKLVASGAHITNFNIGDPNKYDFSTPQHMLDALCGANEVTDMGYTPSEGNVELRKEILSYESTKGLEATVDDILVTNGVSEAIHMLIGASLDPGDDLLVPGPAYPPYTALTRYFDATPVTYDTVEDEEWAFDIDDMRAKITDHTKAITIINPNNPTGALLPKKQVKEVVDLCGEHGLFLISDEIYDRIIYEGEHVSPMRYSSDVPVVLLNGFSKVYLVPGWRVGYMAFHDPEGTMPEIEEAVKKYARLRLCPNAPCQQACIAALRGPQDHISDMIATLRKRRDFMHRRLNEIEGIECQRPSGAFYIFPKITHPAWNDDKQFVLDVLHDCHVLFVHGSGFSPTQGKMHFRGVFLPPIETIDKALSKVERYMDSKR